MDSVHTNHAELFTKVAIDGLAASFDSVAQDAYASLRDKTGVLLRIC